MNAFERQMCKKKEDNITRSNDFGPTLNDLEYVLLFMKQEAKRY